MRWDIRDFARAHLVGAPERRERLKRLDVESSSA